MSNKESYIINKNSEIKSQLCHFLLTKKIRYLYIGTRTLRTSWTELVGTLPDTSTLPNTEFYFQKNLFFSRYISLDSQSPAILWRFTDKCRLFPSVPVWNTLLVLAPSAERSEFLIESEPRSAECSSDVARALYWHPVAWTFCGVGAFESIFIYCCRASRQGSILILTCMIRESGGYLDGR